MNTLASRFFILSFCLLFILDNASGIAGGRLKAKSKSTSEIAQNLYAKGVKASNKAAEQEKKSMTAASEGKKHSYHTKAEKQYKKAIGFYKKALRLMPNLASARTNLGHALLKTGNYADALEALDKALNLDNGNEKAQIYRAEAIAALHTKSSSES